MKKTLFFSSTVLALFLAKTVLAQPKKPQAIQRGVEQEVKQKIEEKVAPDQMPPTRIPQQDLPDEAKIQIQQGLNENGAAVGDNPAVGNNQAGESGRPMQEGQGSTQPAQRNNQNQVQNEGQDSQLQNSNQGQAAEARQRSLGENRSEVARQHMSQVATQVQKMLAAGNEDPGIGPKVREIAQNQQETQSKLNENVDELDQRKKWVKSLIGPNFRAIDTIEQELETNQERIDQLQELKAEAQTEAAKAEIEQTVQALQAQKQTLEQVMEQERSQFSLFGWLFKRINS